MPNSDSPLISVIVHFLNAETHLRDAIRSVHWQTLPRWELILVDGGSTDRSPALAQDYARREPHRVRSLRHPGPGTLGISSSRIWGAREARAPDMCCSTCPVARWTPSCGRA
jgi:glycosyltransferase involved in cell wall biosynthesis